MAIAVTGIDYRDSDNAHAWGDDETDVWLGINKLGEDVTLPRNSEQALAFVKDVLPLGWLEESGVPIETSIDSTDFNAMQGSALIKTKITKITRSFTVQALEENTRVTSLYWDHDTPKAVADGEALIEIPNSISTINCWAILSFTEGDYYKIYVFPSVDITDRGTLEHTNTSLSVYQMTAKIKKAGWMFTNNPEYSKVIPEKEKNDFSAADSGRDLLNKRANPPAGQDG